MKRRKFLTIAGIGGLLVGTFSFRFFSESFEEAGAKIIRRELPFLQLDPEGVWNYMEAYGRTQDDGYKRAIRLYRLIGVDSTRSGKVHQLVSHYLLSTDFFIKGGDESRLVRYYRLYNPYVAACAHPFSHLRFPDNTA